MKHIKYTTIHMPKRLLELIDNVIENETLAYSSRTEFIKDAVRRYLETLGYFPPNLNPNKLKKGNKT